MPPMPEVGALCTACRTTLALLLGAVLWFPACIQGAAAADAAELDEKVRVFRVFSGDAVLVRQRGRTWRARLDGVEAPDPASAAGEGSRAILEKMIGGRHVRVRVLGEEPDGYRRVRMRLEQWDIAVEMARAGAVWVRSNDPELVAAQTEARAAGLCLWAVPVVR
jgi:endonuclease YncB( thermonuclease family)